MAVKEPLKENEKILKKYKLRRKQIYKSRTLVDSTYKHVYNIDIERGKQWKQKEDLKTG